MMYHFQPYGAIKAYPRPVFRELHLVDAPEEAHIIFDETAEKILEILP